MSESGALGWPGWSRVDDRGLARFVTPQASRWLPLPVSRYDLGDRPDRQLVIARGLYDALKERGIRYDLEAYHPAQELQTIRTPPEVVVAPRTGTCLDLAALYCGLGLAYELLPVLIVIHGHALAAVSLVDDLRAWNANRAGRSLFNTGPLTDPAPLRQLIDSGEFFAVECTGFAESARLGEAVGDAPEAQHRDGGVLSFERAVAAGRQQLELPSRPFQFAVDVAVAHYGWRIEPHLLVPAPGAYTTSIFRLPADASESLRPALKTLHFERLVNERTAHFVGRDFIIEAVDQLLDAPDFPSGYILIHGEPGIGKTALLSQLVKTRGYVHHFNIAPQNIRSSEDFLANVCAQLIIRYKLDHQTLPPEATRNSAFLTQLLDEAAAKAAGRPVVILADALDEAEDRDLSTGANRLYLPPALPDNVFFVVSSRELKNYRLSVDRLHRVWLRDDDPRNRDDVLTYVRGYQESHHDEMAPRIRAWDLDSARFAELITAKSQGNFMYVVHVLKDVRTGALSPKTIDNVHDLPEGLREYYERHWKAMRGQQPEAFERVYEPVLRTLATIREPISLAELQEYSGVAPARIRDVVREWRQFLNEETSPSGEPVYRVYHASFQDFLAEEGVGLQPYHRRIATAVLRKLPEFFEGS